MTLWFGDGSIASPDPQFKSLISEMFKPSLRQTGDHHKGSPNHATVTEVRRIGFHEPSVRTVVALDRSVTRVGWNLSNLGV
jgi:hypothetical protein